MIACLVYLNDWLAIYSTAMIFVVQFRTLSGPLSSQYYMTHLTADVLAVRV